MFPAVCPVVAANVAVTPFSNVCAEPVIFAAALQCVLSVDHEKVSGVPVASILT